jgi:hypothetical protein
MEHRLRSVMHVATGSITAGFVLLNAAVARTEPAAGVAAVDPARDAPTRTAHLPAMRSKGHAAAHDQRDRADFEQHTWLGEGRIDHGGYGGALARMSSFNGDPALFVGGRGGWLIDHHLVLGGAGMGQALSIAAPAQVREREPDVRNVEFGYGGLFIGYHLAPERRLHGFVSVLMAGGGLALSDRSDDDDHIDHSGDGLLVLEPEVALEANLIALMRVQFTLSYRQVWGVETAGLDNGDASGIAFGLACLFGQF